MQEDRRHPPSACGPEGEEVSYYSISGDIGDLLAALPHIKHHGAGNLVLFPAEWTGNRMTRERVASLKPFLLQQPYIRAVEWSSHPVGLNIDGWRKHYNKALNLSDMMADYLEVPRADRDQPWLTVDEVRPEARVVFARSPRYNNRKVDWKALYDEYRDEAVFLGTKAEHNAFEQQVGPVHYIPTANYLELARIVAGAELVCVNQTSIRWLAEGFKLPVIVEVDPSVPNTHWDRYGAYYLQRPHDPFPTLNELDGIYYGTLTRRASGYTLLTEDRLGNIARLARSTEHLEGDMAEVGTFRGGSAAVICGSCPGKTLHVFDTFQGIPEDDQEQGGHRKGDFKGDIEQVRKYLELYRIEYHIGTFPDTAPSDDRKYSFVHLDGDTYQTTRAGLAYFLPRMTEGGVIVLDDYGWKYCPGVKKAVDELPDKPCVCVEGQHAWLRV